MTQVLVPVAIVALGLGMLACEAREAELAPRAPQADAAPVGPLPNVPEEAIAPSRERAAAPEKARPEDLSPKLSELLRLPVPEESAPDGPQSVDWAGQREEEKREAARKKSRAKIDFSQENVTEGIPMQKERRRTDVGVSVPAGESEKLRVRGGVRIDEREISEDEREAETAPTVGVEVRF